MIKKLLNLKKGFTLVELMVSVAIFAFMTAFIVSKYGNFNQGILLTNLAYDVALTIRNAQFYGLNVKSNPISGALPNQFNYAYGVHFDKSVSNDNNKKVVFFVDIISDGLYDSTKDGEITTSNIRKGNYVSNLCVGSPCTSVSSLDITFLRPDPNAIINANGGATKNSYAEITLQSTDGTQRKVSVRSNGQISVCGANNICN